MFCGRAKVMLDGPKAAPPRKKVTRGTKKDRGGYILNRAGEPIMEIRVKIKTIAEEEF